MDTQPQPFVPPHPIPRTTPPSVIELIRTVVRNPVEIWGENCYTKPYVTATYLGERTLVANDPGLVRRILVENPDNFRMSRMRQLILRPILRDGLISAEGEVWKRTRKVIAPMFTPRHIKSFADMMHARIGEFLERYRRAPGQVHDISIDMTHLTYEVLSVTLFSDEIASDGFDFANDVNKLLSTMGRVDPMDMIKAPGWVPRFLRMRGRKVLRKFDGVVEDTIALRRRKMTEHPDAVDDDFLALLLAREGPGGLTSQEIADNLITFIGAGHETTARALGWTLYLLANSPQDRALIEDEVDRVLADNPPPVEWLDLMPKTRAAFEEAMRLYPPAPSINREAIEAETFTFEDGSTLEIEKDMTTFVIPWVLHRHREYWDNPDAFMPSRFWPENRDRIGRFQYLPFGMGPRICVGATFSLQEGVIALAMLMREFRFEMTPGLEPWPIQKLTMQAEHGLPMRVEKR